MENFEMLSKTKHIDIIQVTQLPRKRHSVCVCVCVRACMCVYVCVSRCFDLLSRQSLLLGEDL